MNYRKILLQSWNINKSRSYLWWLGLFTVFSIFLQTDTFQGDEQIKLGDYQPLHFLFYNDWLLMGAVLLFFTVVILLFYFQFVARAGIIKAVQSIHINKRECTFKHAMIQGKKYVWRIIGLDLLSAVLMLLSVVPFAVFALGYYFTTQNLPDDFVGTLIFGWLILFITLMLYISLVLNFATIELIINDRKITEAFKIGHSVVKANLSKYFKAVLWIGCIDIFYVVILLIIIGFFGWGFDRIVFLFRDLVPAWLVFVLLSPIIVIITGVLLWCSAFFSSFNYCYQTLVYFELIKTVKKTNRN